VFSILNRSTIIDYIYSTPEMMCKSFTKKDMVKSFVEGGMLNRTLRSAPDLMGAINLFKVNWDKVKGGKKWFVSMI